MFASALLALSLAAPVPKSLKVRPLALDGRWKTVRVTADGRDLTRTNQAVWQIDGERLTLWVESERGDLRAADNQYNVGLSRPADHTPSEMEYTLSMFGQVMFRRKLLVTVDGGELVVCYRLDPEAPRPSDLTDGPGVHRLRFRRMAEEER